MLFCNLFMGRCSYYEWHQRRYCSTPACVNCAKAISVHALFAAGFAGLGCIITLTLMSPMAASRSAACARDSAYLPTATIIRMFSSRSTSTRARSHAVFSCLLTLAGRSAGVKFFPLRFMNSSGHKLCTKQRRKKFSGVTQSWWNSFQNRAPLTWHTQHRDHCINTLHYKQGCGLDGISIEVKARPFHWGQGRG